MSSPTRFVVAMGVGTREERDKLTLFLSRQPNWGWWHQFDSLWLVNIPGGYSAAALRDLLRANGVLQSHLLVLAVQGDGDWAAFGNPDTLNWLSTNWHDSGFALRKALGLE